MKLLPYFLAFLILPLMFWAAACESAKTDGTMNLGRGAVAGKKEGTPINLNYCDSLLKRTVQYKDTLDNLHLMAMWSFSDPKIRVELSYNNPKDDSVWGMMTAVNNNKLLKNMTSYDPYWDSLRIIRKERDQERKRANAYRDSLNVFRTVTTYKDIQTTHLRLQYQRSLDEMKELQAQLDSAVAVKNRLDKKLSQCNCQPK